MKRGNPQNLVVRTGKEAQELGRKGGIASGIARRAKHAFADVLRNALNTPIPMISDRDQTWTRLLERFGLCDMTAQNLIICSLLEATIKGDIKAMIFIRDTLMMTADGIESVSSTPDLCPTTLEGLVRATLYHKLEGADASSFRELIETDDRKSCAYPLSVRQSLSDSIKGECRRDITSEQVINSLTDENGGGLQEA